MENSIDGEISVGKELSKVFIPLDNSSLIASTTLEGPLKKYKNFDETQVTEILRQQKNFWMPKFERLKVYCYQKRYISIHAKIPGLAIHYTSYEKICSLRRYAIQSRSSEINKSIWD